ncbi:MAG: hypothetical protein IKN55_08960, partial [Oscillospiraceae bacterium]|nr:hypothetical protein [Oscillospiraceae bacterium]
MIFLHHKIESGSVKYTITPTATHYYTFRSENTSSVHAFLYEGSTKIKEDTTHASYNSNFLIETVLEAGKTYTLEMKHYHEEAVDFTLVAEEAPGLQLGTTAITLNQTNSYGTVDSAEYFFFPKESGVYSFRSSGGGDFNLRSALFEYDVNSTSRIAEASLVSSQDQNFIMTKRLEGGAY